jgi:hypothetical protein
VDNLIFALLNSWINSYCYTGDDGGAVEAAIVAVAQKHLYGEVDSDKHSTHVIDLLEECKRRIDETYRS